MNPEKLQKFPDFRHRYASIKVKANHLNSYSSIYCTRNPFTFSRLVESILFRVVYDANKAVESILGLGLVTYQGDSSNFWSKQKIILENFQFWFFHFYVLSKPKHMVRLLRPLIPCEIIKYVATVWGIITRFSLF